MSRVQNIGTHLVFWSLPLVMFYKGKGIVISYVLFFLLYGARPLFSYLRSPKTIGDQLLRSPHKYIIGATITLALYSIHIHPASLSAFARCTALIAMGYGSWLGLQQLNRTSQEKIVSIFLKGYLLSLSLYALLILSHHILCFIFPMIDTPFDKERYLRGTVILATLTVPALLATRHLKPFIPNTTRLIVFISAVLFFILLHARPDAARLAIFVGIIAGGIAWFRPSTNRFIFYTISGTALIYPFFCLYVFNEYTLFDWMRFLPTSYQHRLQMWHIISGKITDSFLFGHGFDASTTLQDATARCAYFNPIAYLEQKSDATALINGSTPYSWGGIVCYKDIALSCHPHNIFIQIWYEFGLAGILLFIYGLWRVCATLIAYNRLYQTAGFAILAIYGMFFSISFNMWQNWLLSLGGFTIILFKLIRHLYPRGIQ